MTMVSPAASMATEIPNSGKTVPFGGVSSAVCVHVEPFRVNTYAAPVDRSWPPAPYFCERCARAVDGGTCPFSRK